MKFARLVLSAAVLIGGVSQAEEAPPAEAVPFIRLSLRTIGAIEEFAHKTGLATAPHQIADMLGAMFPMVGPKGVNLDHPVVVTMLAGSNIQAQQMAFFALPANDSSEFQKSLEAQGTKPLSAEHKLYVVRGMPFRFMDHYVVFGGTADAVKKLDEKALDETFKDSTALARLDIDAVTVRSKAPEALNAFLKAMEDAQKKRDADAPPVEDGVHDLAAQEYGRRLFSDYLKNTLDHFALEVVTGEANSLLLNVNLQPFAQRAAFEGPKPELPPGCLIEIHAPYSMTPTEAQLKEFLDLSVMRVDLPKGAKPEDKEALRKSILQMIELIFSGDAQSVGLSMKDGNPVLYGVKQFKNEINFAAQAKSLIETFKKAGASGVQSESMRFEEKPGADGTQNARLTFIEKGNDSGYVDFTQRGKTVFFSSARVGEHLPTLMNIKQAQDKKLSGVEGFIDPSAIVRMLSSDPTMPFFMMEKADLDHLLKGLGDKKITLTATCNEGLKISLKIPAETLKALTEEPPPPKHEK
jgi:hypothetical protein